MSWPSPPPTSGNPFADCLGIINDAAEVALWLSPHILDNTVRVLGTVVGTPKDEAEDFRNSLTEMADASGGGLLSQDHEDNLFLDLAAEVGALLIFPRTLI